MSKLDSLKVQEQELIRQMSQVQAELIAEHGHLEMVAYKARLAESGLLKEWDTLQAQIRMLKPRPKRSINQMRKAAGLTYWKRNHRSNSGL